MFNRKKLVVVLLTIISVVSLNAMEFTDDTIQGLIEKNPKSLRELSLDSIARGILLGFDTLETLGYIKELNIPDSIGSEIACRILSLSTRNSTLNGKLDYARKLFPYRLKDKRRLEHFYLRQEDQQRIDDAAYHPSKNYLACKPVREKGGMNSIQLWDLDSKNVVLLGDYMNRYDQVYFSNQGHYLVSTYFYRSGINELGSYGRFGLHVWNLEILNLEDKDQKQSDYSFELEYSTNYVQYSDGYEIDDVQFSKDGNYLKATLSKGEEKIWHLPTRQELDLRIVQNLGLVFSNQDDGLRYYNAFSDRNNDDDSNILHDIIKRATDVEPRDLRAARFPTTDTIEFLDYRRILRTLKTDQNELKDELKDCSIETALKVVHLAQLKKHKRCLSYLRLELPLSLKQLFLNNAVLAKCYSCKKRSTERKYLHSAVGLLFGGLSYYGSFHLLKDNHLTSGLMGIGTGMLGYYASKKVTSLLKPKKI